MFKLYGDTDKSYWLPRACSNRICFWGGGGGGAASEDLQNITANSIAAQQRMFDQAAAFEKPYREAGVPAVNQWAGLLKLPGYTGLDPTQTLTGTPGYQFLQDQGNQALSRYAAATGLSMSGPAAKSAVNYGQGLAQQYAWQPYMQELMGLSGLGQNAAGMSGNWAMQTGSNMANTYANQANLQSRIDMSQNQGNIWNDILSGAGFAGGLLMAPFTGGTSLLSSGLSGLSNMFTGGGAGAGAGAGGGSSGNYSWSPGGYSNFSSMYPSSGLTFMADGGDVATGRPYVIGERGPELFVPDRPGTIVPNYAMPGNYRIADRINTMNGGSIPGAMPDDSGAGSAGLSDLSGGDSAGLMFRTQGRGVSPTAVVSFDRGSGADSIGIDLRDLFAGGR